MRADGHVAPRRHYSHIWSAIPVRILKRETIDIDEREIPARMPPYICDIDDVGAVSEVGDGQGVDDRVLRGCGIGAVRFDEDRDACVDRRNEMRVVLYRGVDRGDCPEDRRICLSRNGGSGCGDPCLHRDSLRGGNNSHVDDSIAVGVGEGVSRRIGLSLR
jgi:hypothetical protein